MDCAEFFRILYGDIPDRQIVLFFLPDKITCSCTIDEIETEVEHYGAQGNNDSYFHIGLSNEIKRLEEDDVVAIPGMWADVDFASKTSKKKYAPQNQIGDLIEYGLGLKPTLVTSTGGGYHMYWAFGELWWIKTEADRKEAKELSRRWQQTLQGIWQEAGYILDSTFDLARVLRVPGTRNRKCGYGTAGKPFIVEVTEHDANRRYEPDALWMACRASHPTLPLMKQAEPEANHEIAVQAGQAGRATKAQLLALTDTRFKKTWLKTRTDMADQSASSYDLAIANEGISRQWSHQEIADSIAQFRLLHNLDIEKATRVEYLQSTIRKALEGREAEELVTKIEETPPVGRKETLATVSKIIGLSVVGFLRHRMEPRPDYCLVVSAGAVSKEVRLGTASSLLNLQSVTSLLFDAGVNLECNNRRWRACAKLLQAVATEISDPIDDTLDRLLLSYISDLPLSGTAEWSSRALASAPILRDGSLHVHPGHLSAWCARKKEDVKRSSILRLFRRAGWQTIVLSTGGTSRCYRSKPLDEMPKRFRDLISS